MNTHKRMALILLGVVALIIIGYVAYQLFLFSKVSKFLPESGTEISIVERGLVVPYVMKGNALVAKKPNVRTDGSIVFEEKDSPLVDGEKIALVSIPGVTGVALGIIHTDGSFTALLTGTSNKADLVVTPRGVAVVSIHPFISVEGGEEGVLQDKSPQEGEENAVEEKGTAEGPVDFPGIRNDFRNSEFELVAVNLRTGSILSLGEGRSPRLLENGKILALSYEGVAEIHPENGTRTVIFPQEGADSIRGNISETGNTIAVGSPRSADIRLYRYKNGGLEYAGMFSWPTFIPSLTFVDDERFFIRTGTKVVRLLIMPETGKIAPREVAVMKITQ